MRRSETASSAYLGGAGRAGRARGDRADAARRGDRRARQHRLRPRRRLGHRQIPLSRQEHPDHADRSALLGFAGGGGPHVSCCCSARRGCSALGSRRIDIQHHFRGARHRAGDDLRHLSLRRARTDPADGGSGHERRGGGAVARRRGLATFWRVTLPNIKWGAALWRAACAMRARWASSARSRWCPAISAA